MPAFRLSLFYRASFFLLSWITILSLLPGCQGSSALQPTVVSESTEISANLPQAEITFNTETPVALIEGQNLYLEILDEVTGLALNPIRIRLHSDDQKKFTGKIPIIVGSVIKYRYIRDNDPVGIEYNSQHQQVRYRMYVVDGPGTVQDSITAWKSTPYEGPLGRLQGQVTTKTNNFPVVNALIVAGGLQTLTS
jgi:hypothetical protein